jgi:hypothetical protein
MLKETVAMTEALRSVCSNASEEIAEVYDRPKTVVSGRVWQVADLHRKEVKTMQLNEEIRLCYATMNLNELIYRRINLEISFVYNNQLDAWSIQNFILS